jgi:hypothetical protein
MLPGTRIELIANTDCLNKSVWVVGGFAGIASLFDA